MMVFRSPVSAALARKPRGLLTLSAMQRAGDCPGGPPRPRVGESVTPGPLTPAPLP